jgi:hypothetical protein
MPLIHVFNRASTGIIPSMAVKHFENVMDDLALDYMHKVYISSISPNICTGLLFCGMYAQVPSALIIFTERNTYIVDLRNYNFVEDINLAELIEIMKTSYQHVDVYSCKNTEFYTVIHDLFPY